MTPRHILYLTRILLYSVVYGLGLGPALFVSYSEGYLLLTIATAVIILLFFLAENWFWQTAKRSKEIRQ